LIEMEGKQDRSEIARAQCERTANIYHSFRLRGDTYNDLVEVPAMRRLMGDVGGKKVLDVGCGFGSNSVYCAKQGASVTAIDISETMIGLAREEAAKAGVHIDLLVMDATKMEDLHTDTFDLAVSSISVSLDVPDLFKEVARVLRPGGVFCYSEVHPILGGGRRVGEGKGSAWLLDHYFHRGVVKGTNVFGKVDPGDEDYEWLWEHHTLEDYCEALRRAGFLIEALREPEPVPGSRSLNPERFDRASNYPIFVLIRAVHAPELVSEIGR
jgi:ubiquinone/menaquinone biosynthesis C-methylase UbiE